MAIVQCGRGHFYDNEKFSACPVCQEGAGDDVRTVSLAAAPEEIRLTAGEPARHPVRGGWDAEKTVSLEPDQDGPLLAGWLVCVEGSQRGRDFRLYPGFNRIGRSLASGICVQDREVARDNHCAVVYEERAGIFYLVPGMGTLTYLNGAAVERAETLPDGGRITIGKTALVLAAFCKEGRGWQTQ